MAHAEPTVIKLEKYQDLLTALRVTIGGETLPLLFDTGGGVTAISPELAGRLGLEPYGRITAWRKGGERLDLPRIGEIEFDPGGLTLRAQGVLFDLNGMLPSDWPEIGGLLSLHSFADQIITLDSAGGELIIETPTSLSDRIAGMREVKVRAGRQSGGETLDLFVAADTPNGEIWLEVDNSNTGPLLLAPHALAQLGLEVPNDGERWTGEVSLDLIGFGAVDVQAESFDMIYDGLINAATTDKLLLTMDLPNERMWIAERTVDTP